MSHYFLGVPLPKEVRTHLHGLSEHFRQRLNYGYWTDPQDYHITLLFLGAADPKQLEDIQDRLETKMSDRHPADIKLSGFGTFGKRDQPRVLWMGVQADHFLYDVQKIVKECAVASGFEAESRPYRPHITIAKKWRGEVRLADNEWDEIIPGFQPHSWKAEEFQLFEVNPQKTPRYTPIHRFSLT